MRQLFPTPLAHVDPAEAYDEPRKAEGRPWVVTDMVTSVDGATAVDGRSGALGGPGDKAVFRALRAVADVVLVGAGTARAEDYGPVVVDEAIQARRAARGQGPVPRLALVSGRLDLDPDARMFRRATDPPLVFTPRAMADRAPADLRAVAEVVGAGDGTVDLHQVLVELHQRGAGVVLLEGGPSLNGEVVAAGLVDEWCQSVAPVLAAGNSSRVAHGPAPAAPIDLVLHRVLEDDGFLFCSYRRA